MAKVLILFPEQYLQGVVTLFRGDQWNLDFQLKNRIGGVDVVESFAAASGVTGYFPAASGGVVEIPCTAIDLSQAIYRCEVPSDITSDVALVSDATSWYAKATTPEGLQTYPTPDLPLVINDSEFQV